MHRESECASLPSGCVSSFDVQLLRTGNYPSLDFQIISGGSALLLSQTWASSLDLPALIKAIMLNRPLWDIIGNKPVCRRRTFASQIHGLHVRRPTGSLPESTSKEKHAVEQRLEDRKYCPARWLSGTPRVVRFRLCSWGASSTLRSRASASSNSTSISVNLTINVVLHRVGPESRRVTIAF